MFWTRIRITPGKLSTWACLTLWLGVSTAQAEQFVLFDTTFTFTKEDADNSKPSPSHYYVRDKLMNADRPNDWTSPVDYRNGTAHVRLEVLEKPAGGEATTWSVCYIPNKGQKNGYGCFNTPVYKEAGVYEQDIPMTKFWQNDSIVWDQGIKEMHLVIKDNSGGSGHAHKRKDHEKFFPTKVRMTVTQVSAGSKYDASLVPNLPSAKADTAEPVRVTVDNFRRAESDTYFARFVKDGGFGKFHHERELALIDHQTVIRLNRDTLYSFGVFDLDAAPVTVALPDAGKRFMAVQVINEDHYATEVFYAPGSRQFTRELVGTRYVCLAVRTFVNPNDPADIKAVHALQDAIKVQQAAVGKFEIPEWDPTSLKKIREALLVLAAANGGLDSARMFGRKEDVDPVEHLIGTAAGWGGNPRYAALYAGTEPKENDGQTAYRLTVKDVPVDGFWSISVYNKAGFFEKNSQNAYTVNNVTAKPNADGSVTIQFGGDSNAQNYLPITPGWNYVLRMYRPRKAILEGIWKVPEPQLVK